MLLNLITNIINNILAGLVGLELGEIQIVSIFEMLDSVGRRDGASRGTVGCTYKFTLLTTEQDPAPVIAALLDDAAEEFIEQGYNPGAAEVTVDDGSGTTTQFTPATTSTEATTEATTEEATTAEATTAEATTASTESTTEAPSCPQKVWNGPVLSDGSIRPFQAADSTGDIHCVYKRYLDFVSGHDVWVWPCFDHNKKDGIFKKQGRFQWQWFPETGQIRNIGSELKFENKPFCITFYKPESEWKQRAKIDPCDDEDERQQFEFKEGRIHSKMNTDLCMGYEVSKYNEFNGQVALTLMSCFGNQWGVLDAPEA